MGENTNEAYPWRSKEPPVRTHDDKVKELGQRALSRRALITGAAATIAGGILAGKEFGLREERKTVAPKPPTEPEEITAVVVSPELMVTTQDRDFSELRKYQDARFMTYDPNTNEGHVSEEPKIILVKPASYQDQIVFRKGPTLKNEGAVFVQKGTEEFNEIMDKTFATAQLLGPGYGNSGGPGRPMLPEGEEGGTWYAILGATQNKDGKINYHYADLNGGRLSPGEAPVCFSATFGNAVKPQ